MDGILELKISLLLGTVLHTLLHTQLCTPHVPSPLISLVCVTLLRACPQGKLERLKEHLKQEDHRLFSLASNLLCGDKCSTVG